MKINIYYGGRGLIDDPTLYVIKKIEEVLRDLHVSVERYQLYEQKNSITTLPQTMKDADGIILATTVEWYGIGGYMQQFLDACWLYGDKEIISHIYMAPVVMSTTYGEREGKTNLETAWEILGGLPCTGICGYIADTITMEMDEKYGHLIEKVAENIYRSISQRMPCFPASNQAVKQKVSSTRNVDLTPQESEQLSQYAADDTYVQKTKEDIKELASLFRNMMGDDKPQEDEILPAKLKEHFRPVAGFKAGCKITVGDSGAPLSIAINQAEIKCTYEKTETADVEIQLTNEVMNNILDGKTTFQRAFMNGDMKMKGDFNILRALDQVFLFEEK